MIFFLYFPAQYFIKLVNKREEKFVITIFRNFRFANQTQQLINQGQFLQGRT